MQTPPSLHPKTPPTPLSPNHVFILALYQDHTFKIGMNHLPTMFLSTYLYYTVIIVLRILPTGRGAITGIQISLTSFQSNPPSFTLLGATGGGPPTTYTWTRNGQVITNSTSYSISIQVVHSPDGFRNSQYRSTLTVTGRLPGVYQYSVTNRATSGMVTDTVTIESKNYNPIYIYRIYRHIHC